MNAEGFWKRVDRGPGCWSWAGRTNADGRGRCHFDGRVQYAYRVAWELTHGSPIPADRQACHKCDNPNCVNPDHIFIGTAADNMADAAAKGRTRNRPRFGLDHHYGQCTSADEIASAVEEYLSGNETQEQVAARYGVAQTTLSNWLHARVRPDAGLEARSKPMKPCGTRAAYERHRRNGEKPCEECRVADVEHQRARRAAKKVGAEHVGQVAS